MEKVATSSLWRFHRLSFATGQANVPVRIDLVRQLEHVELPRYDDGGDTNRLHP